MTIAAGLPLLHQAHRLLDRCRRGPAAARVDAAERRRDQVGRKALDLEHRQAVGRHVGQLPGVVEPGHRQQAADDAGGAAHDGDVADDERARRLAALEQPGDDLRADAGGIAHGDRQRQRREEAMRHCRRGRRPIIVRDPSPNRCAKPGSCSRRP